MLLAVARQDGIMVLWDVSNPADVVLITAVVVDAQALTSLAFSEDGGWIATTSDSGALRLWGVPRGLAP
jgi:WD40 repeat protein